MNTSLGKNPLPALAVAIGITVLYAMAASAMPGRALASFFLGPFSSWYSFLSLLDAASPLLVASLGAAVAFRSGRFNLGGEGQVAVGALAAAFTFRALEGSFFVSVPIAAMMLAFLAAALAGAALAFISGLTERLTGAEVLLTSFLLAQAAIIGVDWAISGPFRDPASNLLAMPSLPVQFRLVRLFPPAPLNSGAFLALALTLGMAFLLRWTRLGYELRLRGESAEFARVQGFGGSIDLWPLALSGALHGIAGALLVTGTAGRAIKGMTGGIGWNGIAVALVAGTDPFIALPSALFFAWLDSGARSASILADLSPDASSVMKAAVLFLVTARIAFPKPRFPFRRDGARKVSGRKAS